jgi:hypothetical protein
VTRVDNQPILALGRQALYNTPFLHVEISMRFIHGFVVAALLGGLPLAASAQTTKPKTEVPDLDKRYIDSLHGFSLCPPTETQREKRFSTSLMVSWSLVDPNASAILWTLTVKRAAAPDLDEKTDLAVYGGKLAKMLQDDENFTADSVGTIKAAGATAIDLRGMTTGVIRLWQRQVWVPAPSGRFVIVGISGPEDMKATLDRICQNSLDTLQVSDPEATLHAKKANVDRGQELLAGITQDALLRILSKDPQYYLLQLKGRYVGFMVQYEEAARDGSVRGVQVTTYVMMQLPKDELRLMKSVMFTTADRSFERWKQQLQVGSGAASSVQAEDLLKQGDQIVCDVDTGGRIDTKKKPVPKDMYLPRAMGVLLPRLVDARTPTGYSFAAYTSEANDFDMRTFEVKGPGKLTVNGAEMDVTLATDQPAADAEAVDLWLGPGGLLLRLKTAEGLMMDLSSREAVFEHFPKAQAILEAMSKWARQK